VIVTLKREETSRKSMGNELSLLIVYYVGSSLSWCGTGNTSDEENGDDWQKADADS